MGKLKVGLQLYSVRSEMERDFEGTLKKVAEMGYEYVEFAGYFGKTPDEVKALLDKYSLKCISVHQQPADFLNSEDAIKMLNAIGAKYAAVPWYDKSSLAGSESWDKTIETFTKANEIFRANGIQMLYHNHDFEFEKHEGKLLIDYIYEEMPFINPEFDVCWVSYAGYDPCEYIRKFAGRVNVVHFKDYICKNKTGAPVYGLIGAGGNEKKATREENGFEFKPLGQGVQNFDDIIKACLDSGTEYVIVEQDQTYDIPCLEACRMSREFLKSKGL